MENAAKSQLLLQQAWTGQMPMLFDGDFGCCLWITDLLNMISHGTYVRVLYEYRDKANSKQNSPSQRNVKHSYENS